MSEDRVPLSEERAHNPPAAAAGAAIVRRAFSRLGRGRGLIPPEAAEELPGRIARVAQGRLPLLDALRRRWGSAAAAWPDAAALPLVTGSARAPETAMMPRAGETRPYPPSSAGMLPVVEARRSPAGMTGSAGPSGPFAGKPAPAAFQPAVGRITPPSEMAPGAAGAGALLPAADAGRSAVQRDSAFLAEDRAAGSQAAEVSPTPPAKPVVVPAQEALQSSASSAAAILRRQASAMDGEPARASSDVPAEVPGPLPGLAEAPRSASGGPVPSVAGPGPVERPLPVEAAPANTLSRRAAASGIESGAAGASGASLPAGEPAGSPLERSPGNAIGPDAPPRLAAPPVPVVRAQDLPVMRAQDLPVVQAQAAPVGPPTVAAALPHRPVGRGTEADAALPAGPERSERAIAPAPAPAVGVPSPFVHLPPAVVARRAEAEPSAAAEADVASRQPAPAVIRVWGEPIVQRVRGRREKGAIALPAAPVRGRAAPSVQPVSTGTLPLQVPSGAESGSMGNIISPAAPAPTGVALPAAALPATGPIAGSPRVPARVDLRTPAGPRTSAEGAILRQAAPVAPAPVKPARAQQAEELPALPVSPAISSMPGDHIAAARPPLPLLLRGEGEQWTSSTTMAALLQRQEASAPLPYPLPPAVRQTEGSATGSASTGAGSRAGASPGESPTTGAAGAGSPAAGSEGRVRLDESEMERVTNTVLQMLKQRLQMEREARGI